MLDVKLQEKPLEYGQDFDFAVSWYNDEPVRKLEVALGYTVTARNNEHFYTTSTKVFEHLPREGRETVVFPIPEGPYGCDGVTIQINWQLEVSMKPGKEVIYHPLKIGGGNVALHTVLPPELDYPKRLRRLVGAPKK